MKCIQGFGDGPIRWSFRKCSVCRLVPVKRVTRMSVFIGEYLCDGSRSIDGIGNALLDSMLLQMGAQAPTMHIIGEGADKACGNVQLGQCCRDVEWGSTQFCDGFCLIRSVDQIDERFSKETIIESPEHDHDAGREGQKQTGLDAVVFESRLGRWAGLDHQIDQLVIGFVLTPRGGSHIDHKGSGENDAGNQCEVNGCGPQRLRLTEETLAAHKQKHSDQMSTDEGGQCPFCGSCLPKDPEQEKDGDRWHHVGQHLLDVFEEPIRLRDLWGPQRRHHHDDGHRYTADFQPSASVSSGRRGLMKSSVIKAEALLSVESMLLMMAAMRPAKPIR